ncbi:MAG: DUF1007 family protein [Reyranella sp.]|nr:DUF1007 family protein [Reyranella sp.]MBL6653203.1 DUF1007 family protein [Reyranella sp.]
MRTLFALAAGLCWMLLPTLAAAHPHIWIQQVVRVVAKDGKYTHVEVEWKFDPFSSEVEIPLIDEDKDGKFSVREIKALESDMMPELKNYGYMTWLNIGGLNGGGKDVRPAKPPVFTARIDDPATFTLPDWDRSAGDNGMPMPQNKQASQPPGPRPKGPRNLVYVMRFELPQPTKTVHVTTFDPDDFIRVEVDKNHVPAGCMLAKHPTYKAEFVRGYPVFADTVTCQLP